MEQQAWILSSILTQLERQEAADDEAPNGTAAEFMRLKCQSTKYRSDKTFSSKTAEKQDNIKKNRYKDIVPFDHTRVKLTFSTSKKDSDYINASFIKGVSGSKAYIATQGPLPHTVVDFLRMLWEYNIQIVVMSCREFELGKKKCELYWPQQPDQAFVCEPFKVHCVSEENKGDYLTRTLRLTYSKSSRTLTQLHYVNWPDHGVPDTIPPILDMLHEMRVLQAHDDVPICLHCSAGCGRTGALMVIDYTWNLLRRQMITSDFSVYNLVQEMRTQRPSVVQTKEQYLLVYRTIRELFQRYLLSMEGENCQKEPQVSESENELSDQSDEFDLTPEHQHPFIKESNVLNHHHNPSSSASDSLSAFGAEDVQWVQQQYQPFQTPSNSNQDLSETTRSSLLYTSQTASEDENPLRSGAVAELNPPPLQTISDKQSETVCLMVEDPYFDAPTSSSSGEVSVDPEDDCKWIHSPLFNTPALLLNDQGIERSSPGSVLTDDEVPPPLPERTPESYVLAVDTELSDPCQRLSVIFPANAAAAEDVGELEGSPPSPAPPLPERTPESFELATDPVTHQDVPPANLDIIGIFPDRTGNSVTEAAPFQNKTPFLQIKNVRGDTTLSAPAIQMDHVINRTSTMDLDCPLTPPPHLPLNRTPEAFIPSTEDAAQEKSPTRPHSVGTPSLRVGMSSEWDGTSQPRSFLNMSRSKSVRARSSKQEPLTAFQQLTPLPVVAAQGGSAQVEQRDLNRKPSLNADKSDSKADRSNEKSMPRSKSLKLFRHKQRPTTAPPAPPVQPGAAPPSLTAPSALFKLGFGNRFGKPKGPRSYPETWI